MTLSRLTMLNPKYVIELSLPVVRHGIPIQNKGESATLFELCL